MEKKSAVVEVKAALYGLEAVYRACYTFLDRAYIKLEGDPNGSIRVQVAPKPGAKMTLEALEGEFQNELIHQALRLKVASSNQKLRDYIVTQALASAEGVSAPQRAQTAPPSPDSLMDENLEKEIEKLLAEVEAQGADDPLKIVPWKPKDEDAKEQVKKG